MDIRIIDGDCTESKYFAKFGMNLSNVRDGLRLKWLYEAKMEHIGVFDTVNHVDRDNPPLLVCLENARRSFCFWGIFVQSFGWEFVPGKDGSGL